LSDTAGEIVVQTLERGELGGVQACRRGDGGRVSGRRGAEVPVWIDTSGVVAPLRGEAKLRARLDGVVALDLGDVVSVLVDR